jgi:hypothetical protein
MARYCWARLPDGIARFRPPTRGISRLVVVLAFPVKANRRGIDCWSNTFVSVEKSYRSLVSMRMDWHEK